jgi:hypothetical protein
MEQKDPGEIRRRIQRLEHEIGRLRQKRARVIDSFLEGLLTREERDGRLAALGKQTKAAEEMLMCEIPPAPASAQELASAFSPLFDWPVLDRQSKRRILAAMVAEIRVSNYVVSGLTAAAAVPGINRSSKAPCSPLSDCLSGAAG